MGRWLGALLDERLDMSNGLRREKRVGAHITDFRGDAVKNQNIAMVFYGMHDGSPGILAWATVNAAFHRCASLPKGVGHFGGFGS